ncbi:MAG: hypothetical protein WA579_19215 [Rhodomicrobium sp.]
MDASADCPAIAQHPKQRSRISNHRDLLPNLMGTSSGARRFRDLVNSYIADMGGIDQVGAIKLDLIRRLAAIVVQCELLESAAMQGQKVDISVLCTLASTSVRISSRLGLERVAKDVTTLEQYLAEREELADRDIVQRLDDLNGKP